MEEIMSRAIQKESFWVNIWQAILADSEILKTQYSNPQGWKQFYNEAGYIFDMLWGDTERLGKEMTRFFLQEGILKKENSVLEVGCGTGWLSLAMAEAVSQVVALDYSHEMLKILEEKAKKRNITNIKIICEDFNDFSTEATFDVVVAACFPGVLSPEGITRFEQLANTCVIIFQYSKRGFSLSQNLFEHIMGKAPSFLGPTLLLWCVGYLISRGKFPEIRKWPWESRINLENPKILELYQAYFSIFGFDKEVVKNAFNKLSVNHVDRNIMCNLALLWWKRAA